MYLWYLPMSGETLAEVLEETVEVVPGAIQEEVVILFPVVDPWEETVEVVSEVIQVDPLEETVEVVWGVIP